MNSAKETVRKAIFGKLRSLRRKLNAQGIPCAYSRSILSHENGDGGFKITCDAALLPRISVRNGEAIEEFDTTNFEEGLARVRELFHGNRWGVPSSCFCGRASGLPSVSSDRFFNLQAHQHPLPTSRRTNPAAVFGNLLQA